MTVWLIDARGLSRLLGRFAPGSLRPTRHGGTTRPSSGHARLREPAPSTAGGGPVLLEPVGTTFEPLPAPTAGGRRGSARVPAAHTAVEGTYREVAAAPLWRKVLSLLLLLVILAVVGVAIAAIAGATFGIVAELVDSAVG